MKVLDLQCAHEHAFEGWFASEDDFRAQLARGLVECPFCGDTAVVKKLTAARLNLGARPEPARGKGPSEGDGEGRSEASHAASQDVASARALQGAWMKMVREVMANTEDVGERFAEEARRIHYGEVRERGIRGQATPEETQALQEEGIGVLPLPVPKALKGTLQ